MITVKKILVPRDFSESSDASVPVAIELAQQTGAELHLIFADILFPEANVPALSNAETQEELKERLTQELADELDLSIKRSVVRDVAAAPAILNYIQDQDIDLVVMGTHGRRGLGRMLLGSTAEEVVRMAPCPVLTIHRKVDEDHAIDTILVPVDFSEYARAALRHARELASMYGAKLKLLHVIEDQLHPAFYYPGVSSLYDMNPDIDNQAAAQLKAFFYETTGPDVPVTFYVRRGYAAKQIVSFIEDEEIDLVVMPTHGLRGLEHFLLGSVAEKVVRRSPVPVFTVKAFGKSLVSTPIVAEAEGVAG